MITVPLVNVTLAAQADQLVGEPPLLMFVEARIERLRGIGQLLHIRRALAEELRVALQILDDIVGFLLLPAFGSEGDQTISAVLANVAQGDLETGPVLLLLGREAQIGLDTGRLSDNLIGGHCGAVRPVAPVPRNG
jgi:hypothetical protein